MADEEFQKRTIRVLRTPEEGKKGTELSVVAWSKGGREFPAQLACQDVYYTPEGEKKYGKMKGLKVADLTAIMNELELCSGCKDKFLGLLMPVAEIRSAKDAIARAAEKTKLEPRGSSTGTPPAPASEGEDAPW